MLRFFRSNSSIVIVTTLLIGVVTWLHVLGESEISLSAKYGTFMFRALSGWFVDAQKWFGLILFLLTAILMIFVNARLHLIEKSSCLPALCYVLLIGGVGETHLFNPALIATIFLGLAFIHLAEAFESERLSYNFFMVSVFISFAAFFYQYMYVYLLVVWLVIVLLRPGYWREWVFSVLGFALPLFFAFSWFFLIDDDYTRMGVFFEERWTPLPVLVGSYLLFLIMLSLSPLLGNPLFEGIAVLIYFVIAFNYDSSIIKRLVAAVCAYLCIQILQAIFLAVVAFCRAA